MINLSGCVDQYGNTNYEGGATLGGAATGAFIGSRFGSGGASFIGGAIGALAGGAIGNQIGKRMDANARQAMNRNALYALNNGKIGQNYGWKTNNANGSFIITKEYEDDDNSKNVFYDLNKNIPTSPILYCREFTQKINIGGKIETGYGKACRQTNGDWKIVN